MALPPLPDDILRTNILTRLAAKSLIRFRSVCKLWNSIISETDFIKNHLYCTSQNPNDDNLIITKRVNEKDQSGKRVLPFGYLAILTSSDLSETRLMHVPYSKHGFAEIDMIGSINGLVCLFHRKLHQFIIWNPAIRQAMIINSPDKPAMESYHDTISFFGFFWDAIENDFKVVISYFKTYSSPLSLYVYSCNLGSWSLPRNSTFSDGIWLENKVPSAIVAGVPHWTYSPYHVGTQRLIKFDAESKDFRVLPILYVSEDQYVILVNLKDCLSALVYGGYYYDSTVNVHCFDERHGVWNEMYNVGPITGDVLNRSVWRNVNSGVMTFNGIPILDEAVLSCFKYGGEILFSAHGRSKCYNHKTNKVTDLQNQKGYINECFSYKESLIFLEGMKPQHQVESLHCGSNNGSTST